MEDLLQKLGLTRTAPEDNAVCYELYPPPGACADGEPAGGRARRGAAAARVGAERMEDRPRTPPGAAARRGKAPRRRRPPMRARAARRARCAAPAASPLSGLPPADADLEAFAAECMAEALPHVAHYMWQREAFTLTPSTSKPPPWQRARPRRAGAGAGGAALPPPAGPPCLWGAAAFGDSVDDEWFVVWLLRGLTVKFPGAAARVWDDDGEFLLIEVGVGGGGLGGGWGQGEGVGWGGCGVGWGGVGWGGVSRGVQLSTADARSGGFEADQTRPDAVAACPHLDPILITPRRAAPPPPQAAYSLPRWLKPEVGAGRVWLLGGCVHVVPLPSPRHPTLPAAPGTGESLQIIRSDAVETRMERCGAPGGLQVGRSRNAPPATACAACALNQPRATTRTHPTPPSLAPPVSSAPCCSACPATPPPRAPTRTARACCCRAAPRPCSRESRSWWLPRWKPSTRGGRGAGRDGAGRSGMHGLCPVHRASAVEPCSPTPGTQLADPRRPALAPAWPPLPATPTTCAPRRARVTSRTATLCHW
jgi:hypothetical protein